jgi:hypothetical protein
MSLFSTQLHAFAVHWSMLFAILLRQILRELIAGFSVLLCERFLLVLRQR